MVSIIHDSITKQSLPDLPAETTPAPGKPISRARARMETIPHVPVGQIIGLLNLLHDNPDLEKLADVAWEISKEFQETLQIVKAAEILELVDTPKNDIVITPLGKEFISANQQRRTEIFCEQINKLKLFHIIIEVLKVETEVDEDRILGEIASALPYESAEQLLKTMIAWGRYARILDYNRDTRRLFLPTDEEENSEINTDEL